MRAHLPTRDAWRRAVPGLVVLASSYAFRLPPLLNARSTNSDAAVVGLQAMHLLRGELSPFLWGSGYQTSADSFVAAAWFALFGASPLVLMLSSLSLHVLSTWLVFAMARRRFDPWTAVLLTLPLVLTPSSVHSYALYPPRQLSLTLAMASFWAIDRTNERRGHARSLVLGGALATLGVAADPYALLLVPLSGLYALLVLWRAGMVLRGRMRLGLAYALGALAGAAPFYVIRHLPGAKSGPMGLTTSMLAHHWDLLVKECLPWALSYKVYFARDVMDYRPWDAPAFTVLGGAGAVLLAALVVYALSAPRRAPGPVRRLGFVGALGFPLTISAFLVSVMAMDHFSMRYLTALTLMTPFALMPAAHRLGAKRLALLVGPHLVASAVGGWVGYGPFVKGPLPVVETPELRDDYALRDVMRERGLRYAMADYWASYRLTFLFREEIVVVPRNPGEDRYAPYRRAFEKEPVFAYVFDPGRSREPLDAAIGELAVENERVERIAVGRLTVLVVNRRSR